MTDFQAGDIVLTRSPGFSITRLLAHLYWNHVLIIDVPLDDDYGILESINKGVAIGMLSFYKGHEIAVYRWKGISPEEQNDLRRAARYTGRYRYDFFVVFRVLKRLGIRKTLQLLYWLWTKENPPIPHIKDSYVVCSEFAQETYSAVGKPLIDDNYLLLPDTIPFVENLELVRRMKL